MKSNFFEDFYFNQPILESENFVVVPSIGSLIPGWVLIVPKHDYLSFADIPEPNFTEIQDVIKEATTLLKQNFGDQFVMFEHGPSSKSNQVGCGVDYAHLHIVPGDMDLIRETKILGYDFDWVSINSFSDLKVCTRNNDGYLYLMDSSGRQMFYEGPGIPSQLFRRAIANTIGIPNKFNWKEFPFHENIDVTLTKLLVLENKQ